MHVRGLEAAKATKKPRMQKAPTRSSHASPSPGKAARTDFCIQNNCNQPRHEKSHYCLRHILQDPTAPYKQCAYTYNSTGKRCLNIAPKLDKKDGRYCAEHSRKALAMRIRSGRQRAPKETADTLLQSLSHYIPHPGKVINPFEDIDATRLNTSVARVLDLASDSDSEPSEGGNVTLDAAWSGDSESEGDSADSDMDDPLRHAGVYTEEEVVAQAKESMVRLQNLYVREFRSLQFKLREQRRHYLASVKKEKETMMSIHQQPKNTSEEQSVYKKLQALNRYHKLYGVEAVLHKREKDRKAQALLAFQPSRQSHASRCTFTEGGVKCDDRAMPYAKLCLKHILNDSQQLLLRPCGAMQADLPPCQEPVLAIFPNTFCPCHSKVPKLSFTAPEVSGFESPEDMELDILPKIEDKLYTDLRLKAGNSSVTLMDLVPPVRKPYSESSSTSSSEKQREGHKEVHSRRKQDLSETRDMPHEISDSDATTLTADDSYRSTNSPDFLAMDT
ncbi:KAT8 regulatory NSL complex subunit 2-like isoform X2 [Neocloeon triangulifer]|uniref:KAT8 regulatory NSL complex subunit 2-like isoform X2 n=1 Tax=Neocloeon triangulifer TaxID=2078957 RepID=UPI00286EB532|nr:KAT8 regulatory NSL complex subunit 2-like isoform X2 [Neocloeon triangulifer]